MIIAAAIKVFSLFPAAVERYYSQGIYLVISRTQRFLLGWIPFSIGDLLYGGVAIYLIITSVRFGWQIARRRHTRRDSLLAFQSIVIFALSIYIWFNVSWGLNYNRISITERLQLTNTEINPQDLKDVMNNLVLRLNTMQQFALENRQRLDQKKHLFKEAVASYDSLNRKPNFFSYTYPAMEENRNRGSIFNYQYPAVKPSLYSYLGNYLGFTGYYNPFTGEAQVNTTVPAFILPFTTCHEIGHQLGFAKENEANLAGFLSARSSSDPAFLYSVYFEMYSYSRRYLYALDSMELKRLDSSLVPGVTNDYRILRQFLADHANPVEVLIDKLYSRYLRANEQPSGRVTYNEVVLLLVAYWKKYREI